MFNIQAFISTLFIIACLWSIYGGAIFFLYHKWIVMRIFGLAAAAISLALIISHVVSLVAGA